MKFNSFSKKNYEDHQICFKNLFHLSDLLAENVKKQNWFRPVSQCGWKKTPTPKSTGLHISVFQDKEGHYICLKKKKLMFGGHLVDHLLWSIFQSTGTYYRLQFLFGLWGHLPCTASSPLSFDLLWALLFAVLLLITHIQGLCSGSI